MAKRTLLQEFTKGLWEQIPPFRLVLGLCPTLAVTKSLEGGWGMGVATTFVLVCSNVLIALLRPLIPPKVRVPVFILIIATFVVIVELVMKAFTPALSASLGVFIPLIVVNCIILGRAEAFASKNGPLLSLADGLGIGIGFTLSLAALAAIREVLGAGTFLGLSVFGAGFEPFEFLVQAPGAFVCLGLMLGVMNVVGRLQQRLAAAK